MTIKVLKARDQDRVREALAEAFPPDRCTDVCMVVEHTPGELIAGTSCPSGRDGTTQYGPAWVVRGRETSAPVALFDTQLEARFALGLLAGPDSELGIRKEARRRRIAEIEAAEAAAEAEAKEAAKATRALARKGVDISEATGGGSSRRERSSARRTAGMRMRVEETRLSSLPA